MIPQFRQDLESPHWSIVRIRFRHLARVTVALPLGGFIFIVFRSLWTDWQGVTSTTYTHCDVTNYLPTISSAMENPLQKFVWRLCIAVHAIPRFYVTWMYYHYLASIINPRILPVVVFACGLNVFENLGLLGLTFTSSSTNYEAHKNSFIVFITCSEFYMLALCLLLHSFRNFKPSGLEAKSLRVKIQLLLLNWISFCIALVAFARHNSHCETGMYTVFAFFEYIVVLTNMGFHMTAYWDFFDKLITIDLFNMHLKQMSWSSSQSAYLLPY